MLEFMYLILAVLSIVWGLIILWSVVHIEDCIVEILKLLENNKEK